MSAFLNPLSFLVACLSGWLSEHQQRAIEYLISPVDDPQASVGLTQTNAEGRYRIDYLPR